MGTASPGVKSSRDSILYSENDALRWRWARLEEVSTVPPGLAAFFFAFPGLRPGLNSGASHSGLEERGTLASLARPSEDSRYVTATAKVKNPTLARCNGAE